MLAYLATALGLLLALLFAPRYPGSEWVEKNNGALCVLLLMGMGMIVQKRAGAYKRLADAERGVLTSCARQ